MASHRPRGDDTAPSFMPPDGAEDVRPTVVPPDAAAAVQKAYLDFQQPVEIRTAERTILAGSIAPGRRKVEPSLEVAELGRGGIGRVFVSIDMALQREIAIKEILPELLEGDAEEVERLRARFLREARVTGQLEHPNIVPVYEVGQREDGGLYYAMRLIRGKTLKQAIDEAKHLPGRLELLNHFLGLCQAIAYAHSRGVIHRDIKPQNVMLGEFGETVVLDWGVAKVREARSSLSPGNASAIREPEEGRPEQTQLGQLLGTPAYMAPEGLLGQPERVDERSDVWSLGVVLYLLLKGRLPFEGTLPQLLMQARSAKAAPLRALGAEVPPELRAVVERALERNPERRYQTAGEMASDIQAYMTGAKVGAYAYSSWELVRRFYMRQRTAVLVGLSALLAIVVVSVLGYYRVVVARDRAVQAEERQRVSAEQARETLARLLAKRAIFALSSGQISSAELLAAQALTIAPRQDALGVAASLSPNAQPRLERSEPFATHCKQIARAADAGTLACASEQQVVVVADGKRRVLGQHQAEVTAVALSAAGERLYSADRSGVLRWWSLPQDSAGWNSVRPEGERRLPAGAITALVLDADESRLAVGLAEGRVELYGLPELGRASELTLGQPVSAIAMSASGAVAVGGRWGALRVWGTPEDGAPVSLAGHSGTLTALAFSPDGARLASGSADRNVRVWNLRQPERMPALVRSGRVATSLAWSTSNHHLIYGTREHRVYWVDLRLGRAIAELPGHEHDVLSVALSDDEQRLVTVDSSLLRRVWRVPDARWRHRLVESSNVLALTWARQSAGAELLVSAGVQQLGTCLWSLKRGECETRLPVRSDEVRALAVSPDGSKLAVGGSGGELLIWDLNTRLPLSPLFGHRADIRAVAFSSDGRGLISGDLAGRLVLWDLTGAKLVREHSLKGGIQAVRFSPNGQQLAAATRAGQVELWDSVIERRQATLSGHRDWVMDLDYVSRTQLATAGADGTVRLWDLNKHRELAKLPAGEGRVLALDVSPDDRYLVAGGEDKRVRIWSLADQKLIATLRDHDGAVRSLRFSPSGKTLASASDDRSIRLWDLGVLKSAPADLLQEAERRYGISAEQAELGE